MFATTVRHRINIYKSSCVALIGAISLKLAPGIFGLITREYYLILG